MHRLESNRIEVSTWVGQSRVRNDASIRSSSIPVDRVQLSKILDANRGAVSTIPVDRNQFSTGDVAHDRENLYNSRDEFRAKLLASPRVSRIFTIVANFLPSYNSHQYLWPRILTKKIGIFSYCPSSLVEYVENPLFVKQLISWRILKRCSTTTVSNTVTIRARFHYPTLIVPSPRFRELEFSLLPLDGEGSIFTLIELEINQRSSIFELYPLAI